MGAPCDGNSHMNEQIYILRWGMTEDEDNASGRK